MNDALVIGQLLAPGWSVIRITPMPGVPLSSSAPADAAAKLAPSGCNKLAIAVFNWHAVSLFFCGVGVFNAANRALIRRNIPRAIAFVALAAAHAPLGYQADRGANADFGSSIPAIL